MIITKSLSRLAGNTVTMLETVRELKELNVDVFFEKENMGNLFKPDYITQKFAKILKQNGLKKIRLHDLRHPYVKL